MVFVLYINDDDATFRFKKLDGKYNSEADVINSLDDVPAGIRVFPVMNDDEFLSVIQDLNDNGYAQDSNNG
jgi:hypothetical protein